MSGRSARGLRGGASVTALAIALGLSGAANAAGLPSGGHYTSGSGQIGKSGRSVTVKQSSTTGIIDWNNFSVGHNGKVRFDNGSGATLNVVTGGNISKIAGSLHATGSLYVVNSAGVIVTGNGRVLAGGNFAAAGADSSSSAFGGDDKLKLGHLTGRVANRGTIKAGGSVQLDGHNVNDSGSTKGSGVRLQAQHALTVSGVVQATGGGRLVASGHNIDITGTALLNASGNDGGGSVLIGGRTGKLRQAHSTLVEKGARIRVNAQSGKGGDIIIASDGKTTFDGRAVAKGGRAGGLVETSGEHVMIGDTARISTLASARHGTTGTWLIDPTDFTIAASGGDMTGSTISTNLATTDVLIQSIAGAKSGNGDVIVDDAISWSSGQTLTLDAFRNIAINRQVSITGTGNLVLIDADQTQTSGVVGVNDGNTADGDLLFGGGRIAFTNVASGNTTQLSINGQAYMLENTVADLAAAIDGNSSGSYALANNYNASGDNSGSPYTASPISTSFAGAFEGLGNKISNLTINDPNEGDGVGLFALITSTGEVRDIGVVNANVTGAATASVGGLAGENDGAITRSYATGTVTGDGEVGGLVGDNEGTIMQAHATGTAGATGAAVGGLVGDNFNGTITQSYATGAVTGFTGAEVGGLVGDNFNGTITQSYATGAATGGGVFANVGGLVGFNDSGTITQSYATGAVTGGNAGDVGGLVGENGGSIDESYELGAARGSGSVGGLVGSGSGTIGATTAVYFNSDANPEGGVGGGTAIAQGGGLSRAQMQDTANFAGWNFGTLGSGADWVVVDQSGSLNNSIGAGGTTPMLLSEYSTTITNAHQLQLMELDPTANYTLAKNLDMSATGNSSDVWGNHGFIAIGGNLSSGNFTGTFDGRGHTISNLTIDDTINFQDGLFGVLTGTVQNVGLVDVNITSGDDNVGGLVGDNEGMINASYVTGSISTESAIVGGLVGENSNGTIEASHAAVTVSDGNTAANVGGLTGINFGTIETSYATGMVSDSNVGGNVGGLTGANFGTIETSYATGTVSGSNGANVGGLVGENEMGTIQTSYAAGAVSGSGDVGGLVGLNTGTIETSYATGAVAGGSDTAAGGLVGENDSTVMQSYATGAVSGDAGNQLGGFVGFNSGSIDQSYETGAVTTQDNNSTVGGFAGANDGSIDESYEVGAATSGVGSSLGGFVGANDATIGSTTAVYYNSDANTEAAVGTGNALASGGGLSRVQMENTSNFTGWTFGTLGSGADWVIVDQNGSLNNSGAGGTTPMLLSEYSTTITNAHQLQLMELDRTADYTLANNIDASGTAGGDVWGSQGFIAIGGNGSGSNFTGTLEGAGHTISGLTIDDTTNFEVGLFGQTGSGAVVQNVGLVNVNITGSSGNVGGLVGDNDGTIETSYATGDVQGVNNSNVGGLVGENFSTIETSYATGAVQGGNNSDVGGLVGINGNGGLIDSAYAMGAVQTTGNTDAGGLVGDNRNGATIDNSYAMGSVSIGTGSSLAGGLVGFNASGATIENSYSIGVVSATNVASSGALVGGLVGSDQGSITNSYFDTQTSGFGTSQGDGERANDSGITGLSTSQFQSMSLSDLGFDGSVWGQVAGSFPYLKWQFANGVTPTVISGTVTGEGSGNTVGIYSGGSQIDTLGTFADGSFYLLTGTAPVGGVAAVANNGVAFDDAGHSFDMTVAPGELNLSTNDASLSALGNALDATLGTSSPLGTFSGVQGAATALGGNVSITTNGAFDFDQSLDIGSNTLTLTQTSGSFNQSANGVITAGSLLVEGNANFTLNNAANAIGTLAANTGSLDVTSNSLTIGTVDGVSGITANGGVGLTTTVGDIAITQQLVAQDHPLSLTSAGAITESGSGVIDATTLTGSSNGAVTLNGANVITDLGTFSTGGDNAFALTDAASLTTTGTVDTGSGALTLATTGSGHKLTIESKLTGGTVKLASASTIAEAGSGVIDATTLTGSSDGAVTLDGANVITDLGAFTTGGTFELTDDHDLTVDGTINGGAHTVELKTTGSGHDIKIGSALEAGEVELISAATISETSVGAIEAKTLTGSSVGSVALTASKNAITDLGTFTSGSTFELTDDHDLTVDGTVNSGTANTHLTTTGSGHDIAIDAEIEAHDIYLISAATITESSAGDLDATKLTGSSVGTAEMNSATNTISDLGTFTSGSTFELTDDHNLTVDGTVNSGTANTHLTTTGSGHDIAIEAKIEADDVYLISAATITESSAGDLDATKLSGSSVGTVEMNSVTNTISDLGTFTSGSTFALTDDHDLTVDGTMNSGAANTHLTTTGSGHDIAIEAKIEADDVYLISAATITESSAGDLDATKLTGSSVGTAEMNSATNTISDLGTFTSGSTFELTDDHNLTVDGTVNSGTANTHLTTTGSGHDIAIDAEIEADDIYLVSAATITESSSGDLDAAKLSGSSMGTAEMNSATNTLTDLGTFSTGGNNAFELTDDHALTVDGIVNAGTGTLDLTTTGSNHNLAIDAAITGGTINLVTTGEASESSSNDAISASLLNVTANTGIELTSSKNKIKKLGTDKTKTGPNKVTL